VGVDSGVVGSDAVAAVAAVAEGRERRWGVQWSMGSKGSDCAKGVSSRQWGAADSAQAGGVEIFMVREIWFGSGDGDVLRKKYIIMLTKFYFVCT
jgi:hypothetical protein